MTFSLIALQRTAMHEAGHAVMALDVGAKVFSVTIVEDDECWGHCLRDNDTSLRDDFFISWAGPMAELWVGIEEEKWRSHMGGDQESIEAYAEHLVDSGQWREDEVYTYLNALSRIANKRLERLRPRIEKLAKELMIRQTMTGDEVEELLAAEKLAA